MFVVDAWTGLVRGYLAFVNSRAVEMSGTTLKDSASLVGAVGDGPSARKAALATLKEDIQTLKPAGKVVSDKLVPRITAAAAAIGKLGAAIAAEPFDLASATACAVHLGNLITELDGALTAIADAVAPGATPEEKAAHDEIAGMFAPLLSPFSDFAGGAADSFNAVIAALGVTDDAKKMAKAMKWDRAKGLLSAKVGNTGQFSQGPLTLEDTSFEAFLDLLAGPKLGIAMHTKMSASVRGDTLMAKIIPGEPPTKDKTAVAVTLDTKDGLTLGEGPNKRITLPLRWAVGGVELREMAISQPALKNASDKARIDITTTIAGKFGDAVAIVAEGGGIKLEKTGNGPFVVSPKPPDGLGFRIAAGPVRGGGFLRYREDSKDYGGILDLAFGKVGLTAMGMVSPDPFSFVVIIGVHFMPKIELSFGFTLNGVGGILAVDRRLSEDALIGALKDGVVSNLLFPDDPVAAAPGILDQLALVFPPLDGGFVVGPIMEIGWGSQAGLVKAKVGIVIALPDPKIVILGSVQVQVPPPEVPKAPRLVDLKADLAIVVSPDEFYLRVSLGQSKLAGVAVSGDFGMIVRWAGAATFAMSAGGFFPKYKMPPQLAGLNRITIPMGPPVPFITITATGYFALTTNSIQFGGALDLVAKLGPVKGEGHLGVDALFSWSPKFAFSVHIAASVRISFHGHTIAGAGFDGTLSGVGPWTIQGNASVSILWWDVDFDLGPISWGDVDKEPLTKIDAMKLVQDALQAKAAWSALPPPAADAIVRLRPALPELLMLQPHSVVQAKQTSIPLDTHLDRVGAFPSSVAQIGLTDPMLGGLPAALTSHVEEDFAPGQYLNLTADEQMARPDFERRPAGFQMASTSGITPAPGAVDATYKWETKYPGLVLPGDPGLASFSLNQAVSAVLKTAAVAGKTRRYANAYAVPDPRPLSIADSGLKVISAVDTVGVAGLAVMTTVEAVAALQGSIGKQAITAGLQS